MRWGTRCSTHPRGAPERVLTYYPETTCRVASLRARGPRGSVRITNLYFRRFACASGGIGFERRTPIAGPLRLAGRAPNQARNRHAGTVKPSIAESANPDRAGLGGARISGHGRLDHLQRLPYRSAGSSTWPCSRPRRAWICRTTTRLRRARNTKAYRSRFLPKAAYFRDPYEWSWEIIPQTEIPAGKLGVTRSTVWREPALRRVPGHQDNQKGILPGVLNPGRYPINPYVETNRTARPGDDSGWLSRRGNEPRRPELPENPNVILVAAGNARRARRRRSSRARTM